VPNTSSYRSSRKHHRVVVGKGHNNYPKCSGPTLPGVVSERACAYYGSRWMLGAIPGVIHLVHGPVGCAFYGSAVRKKTHLIFSTDLKEQDVVLGAGRVLYDAIVETSIVSPDSRAVLVYSTCAAGIMGEDLEAVCRRAAAKIRKPVIPVDCPGFKSVSQAGGHDAAARVLLNRFILTGEAKDRASVENGINILGEFNVQGDLEEIRKLLEPLGINIICAVSGKASIDDLAAARRARLNIVHCRRTGRFLAEEMKRHLGIPFVEVSFFGLQRTQQALHEIGSFFNISEAREMAARYKEKAERAVSPEIKKLAGKRVLLFFGASRMGLMTSVFRELGMEIVMVGSQFGSKSDYEEVSNYVPAGTELIDDANDRELEELIQEHGVDLMAGGTKEKYLSHKLGIPYLVFPQETSTYAGFSGFVNLARETAALANAPVWKLSRQGT